MCLLDAVAKPHAHGVGGFKGVGSWLVSSARSLAMAPADRLSVWVVGPQGFLFGLVGRLYWDCHFSMH